MNKQIIELNSLNYKKLQEEMDRINKDYYVSALNMLLWKNYGVDIFYLVEHNAIYVYMFLKHDILINNEKISGVYIFRPIIKKNESAYNYLIKSITNIKPMLKLNQPIFFDRLFKKDIKYFKNYEIIAELDASYIYKTEQFIRFPGKKMQKKRNMYNFFVKNYSEKVSFEKYDITKKQIIVDYCKKHMIETSGSVREYELNSIIKFLNTNDKNISGLIMYHENTVIGVTIGYLRNNVYEIFIEKASHDFKGSYQFLLSTNLEVNNINTKYIDRQDSERQEGLEQSKRSYKPYYVYCTYFVKVNL